MVVPKIREFKQTIPHNSINIDAGPIYRCKVKFKLSELIMLKRGVIHRYQ